MSNEEKPKRKQRRKKGRVFRLDDDIAVIIAEEQRPGETVSETARRVFGLSGEVRYVLPSDIYESVEEARGASVLRAVRTKTKKTERPVPVKEIPRG